MEKIIYGIVDNAVKRVTIVLGVIIIALLACDIGFSHCGITPKGNIPVELGFLGIFVAGYWYFKKYRKVVMAGLVSVIFWLTFESVGILFLLCLASVFIITKICASLNQKIFTRWATCFPIVISGALALILLLTGTVEKTANPEVFNHLLFLLPVVVYAMSGELKDSPKAAAELLMDDIMENPEAKKLLDEPESFVTAESDLYQSMLSSMTLAMVAIYFCSLLFKW